jgi:Asp-tRNA(Asn)/Glu-tRNA(Gln) amidotransferase C subunit
MLRISRLFAVRSCLTRSFSGGDHGLGGGVVNSNSSNSSKIGDGNADRQIGFDGVERWSTKQFFRDAQLAAPVSQETFNSVAELACLEVHESDEQLRRDLGQMIAYVKVIQSVVGDRQSQIEPLVSVAPSTLLRPSISSALSSATTTASSVDEDSNSTVLPRDELLRHSKSTKESYYSVPSPSTSEPS